MTFDRAFRAITGRAMLPVSDEWIIPTYDGISIAPLRRDGRLEVSTDASVLDRADVAVICVPTPLTSSGGPDLRFVETAGALVCSPFAACCSHARRCSSGIANGTRRQTLCVGNTCRQS